MMLGEKVIIVGERYQSFIDDDSGERIEGSKIYFLRLLEGRSTKGYETGSLVIHPDLSSKLVSLPGEYEISYSVRPFKDGLFRCVVDDLVFVRGLSI